MTGRFDYFVIFAEMRTGSNFLESNLNALEGVTCHGEAFNPHFIGYPKRGDILGITQQERDRKPAVLIDAIASQSGVLGGFRYFHDHDPRVLERILDDPRCAKIILTRNPAQSYVSWKIAQATGQWKLTHVGARKPAKAVFDAEEFSAHVGALQAFHLRLVRHLQRTGQTAFHVDYEDLRDLDVINGLAAFLGVPSRLEALDRTLKVQNPAPLADKVENFAEMEASLASIDRFDLSRTPNFEPRRAAAVPTHLAGNTAPLIFLPIQGGPVNEVAEWLAAVDGDPDGGLLTGMRQKDLRKWKRTHPGHRSFTVLRHPVARAHHVFCERILASGQGTYPQIRQTLVQQYGLPVPEEGVGPDWDASRHRVAFIRFLEFLDSNLSGQTAIRVDATWCSQSAVLQGFGEFVLPDFVFREADLADDLTALARRVDIADPRPYHPPAPSHPVPLDDIYDEDIETLTRTAYQRDYMMFGFGPWSGG